MGADCASLIPSENRYERTRTRSGAHSIDFNKFPPFINIHDKYKFDVCGICGALEEGGTGNVVKGIQNNHHNNNNNNNNHTNYNNNTVAIKIMPKNEQHGTMETKSLFQNEVDILRRMEHPNIVKLIDIGQDSTNYYIALQLGHGGDLVGIV